MKKILLVLLVTMGCLSAQNLDSLYNAYMQLHQPEARQLSGAVEGHRHDVNDPNVKCGFGLNAAIRANFDRFTPQQQADLAKLFARPTQTDTSIVSPDGFFRIHFNSDPESIHYPGYSIDDLAEVLDDVYNYEVITLGYPAPPADDGRGGDDLYDVYVYAISLYGETVLETPTTGSKYMSYLRMDNDYVGFATEGFPAAQVTAAHEFHHAIQVGGYIFRESDVYYYEITSTAFEEFMYDEVNDYYHYTTDSRYFFRNPSKTISAQPGYGLAVWHLYLAERYDIDIVKRIWELMVDNRAIRAVGLALAEYGGSFNQEWAEFSKWAYFTGSRTKPGQYFEEAAEYGELRTTMEFDLISNSTTTDLETRPVSINVVQYNILDNLFSDTLAVVLANTDLESAYQNLGNFIDVTYEVSKSSLSGGNKVTDNLYTKLTSDNNNLISETAVFNGDVVDAPLVRGEIDFAYPQPFNYNTHTFMNFPVVPNQAGIADLNIYTTSMDLVYSGSVRIFDTEKIFVQWNGLTDDNEKLPTGVYIYVTNSDDEVKKGKFVIYNE